MKLCCLSMTVMEHSEEISKLSTDELIEFLQKKFNFCDEVLSKFRGMTVHFCISV